MQSILFQINLFILGCSIVLAGCNSEPEIRQYKVAKKSNSSSGASSQTINSPQRTVGAIVPQSSTAWFFKLMGDPAKLEPVTEKFRTLVESVSFGSDGQPKWTLPDGWRQQSGEGFTFASIFPTNDESLKATVTQLPLPPGELTVETWHSYVEENVNRWRGQLTLPDDAWSKMVTYLEPIKKLSQGSIQAFFVSLDGTSSGASMSPPRFGSGRPALPRFDNQVQETPKLIYKVPSGWKESPGSMLRLASFLVEQGDKSADISIIAAGGDIRGNVDRWQRQLIPDVPDDRVKQVIENAQEVSVNDVPSQVFYMTNDAADEKQAILAAIIPWQQATSLFVKLTGPATIAEANRQQFFELLKTIKW